MAKLDDLKKQCMLLHLNPIPTKNKVEADGTRTKTLSIKDCTHAIQQYYIEERKRMGTYDPSIEKILSFEPMLALQIKNLKPEVQEEIWDDNSDKWLFQEKIDGCRCIITYSPALGFNFYSRNLSVTDQLPIAYKDNILLPEIDTSKLTFPFVLDSELVPVNKEIDKSGALVPVADTQLNLVSSILSLNSEDSIEIQKTNPMKFMVFDVLFLKEQPLFGKELSYRLGVLGVLYKYLRDAGFPIEIPAMRDKGQSKRSFYDSIVQAGGEGVIAKRLSDPYETKSERSGSWAKIKRKVSESVMAAGLGDTVDAFVIGFEPGTPGTANEHLVASLKFGVELLGMDNQPLEDQDGNTVIHHIATVSGLTQELKEAITYIDPFGNVALKPEIYGKVASIDGQDLSSRNMRFAHAVLVCWREDRSADTCRIREDILRKLIL